MSFVDNYSDSGIGFEGSGFPRAGSADAAGLSSGGGSGLFGGASPWSLAGAGVAGGGLLYDILKGNPTDPNQTALSGEAAGLAGEGSSLTTEGQGMLQYLKSGTLPPALAAKVEQDTQANKARITQNAGTSGVSTDPRQNSALTQDLAAADRSGTIEAGDYQMKLYQAGQEMIGNGLKATGLSSELYQSLYKFDQQQNSDLMSGIGSFAAALAKIAPLAVAA